MLSKWLSGRRKKPGRLCSNHGCPACWDNEFGYVHVDGHTPLSHKQIETIMKSWTGEGEENKWNVRLIA